MLDRLEEFVARTTDRRSTILLGSAFMMLVFGFFEYFADRLTLDLGINAELHASALAAFVGVGAGAGTFVFLVARREQRRIVQDELRRLAELNHRLRNSLQIIADAHYAGPDDTHRKMMMQAVASMDECLKQLFPALGFEHRKQARPERSTASR
ncbi:MAG TPA: hypothetical protein VMU24_11670 [Candidatus Acidoferrales bacterium]|nr:hypothetical protein [Candidatus Acidoferrales bacterium]